ncbi:putative transcription factor, K-box [Helianthus annuus]|nr:putative transcription factor, K-box [Helianthus annuus]
MESILERYERYCYSERQLVATDATPRSWTLEYNKLKSRAELLQRNHRHYMGEDIESLSLKEIQNLEQQLDTGLKNIRARKVRKHACLEYLFNLLQIVVLNHRLTGSFVLQNQLLHESINELQKKGKAIQEQNTTLTKQLKEKEKDKAIPQNTQWEQHNYVDHDTTFFLPQPHPALNMGGDYNQATTSAASGGEGADGRTNQLDLSLQPIYSHHLRCFPS